MTAVVVRPPTGGCDDNDGDCYRLDDGSHVRVRAIRTDDAGRLRRMFDRLSPRTVYLRFFSPIPRPGDAQLRHLATVDHDRREAIVALDGDEIVGVARYDVTATPTEAEIAVTVEDSWQHRGVGTLLLGVLTRHARERGFDGFSASMLAENRYALAMLHRLAPGARATLDSGTYEARLPLRSTGR